MCDLFCIVISFERLNVFLGKDKDANNFPIPEGENIIKVNDLVYKEVVRKGECYQMLFV